MKIDEEMKKLIGDALGMSEKEREEAEKLLDRFQKPNLTPPNCWVESEAVTEFMSKWVKKGTNFMVQGSAEYWGEELWLRLSFCEYPNIATETEIRMVMHDFLGEQWIEPNNRTFIIPPNNRMLSASPATHILFCLSGVPSSDSFIYQTIKMGLL